MKNNILFIGGGSNLSIELARHINSKTETNFFGVSSQKCKKNGIINLFSYSQIDELSDVDFESVFILASRLPHECNDINEYRLVNELINKCLEKIRFCESPKAKIIFLSSFALYSKQNEFIDENTPVQLNCPYSLSKYEMEQEINNFSLNTSIPSIIARMPVFLYRNGKSNFINKLAKSAKENSTATLFNKDVHFGAVYDAENLSSFSQIVLNSNPTNLVNCCSEADIKFQDIADLAIGFGLSEIVWKKSREKAPIISQTSLRSIGAPIPSARTVLLRYLKQEFAAK